MIRYPSSEICKMANVTKKALRHYDKINLLSPTFVDDNGYWYYSEEDLMMLQVIKNLQVIGYSLIEIKSNFDENFKRLRENIPEKLSYIDEQMIQLDLAKRLLKKIIIKDSLHPLKAINESIEEEHIEWYKKNLQPEQFALVEDMMSKPDSMLIHNEFIKKLRELKPYIRNNDLESIRSTIEEVKNLFAQFNLENHTIDILIESFLKSNLEGPFSKRILSVKEVVYLLQLL